MRISDILKDKNHRLVTMPGSAPIGEAVSLMHAEQIGAVIVRSGHGRLLGVLSERDVVLGLDIYGAALLAMSVDDVMTLDVPTAAPTDSIAETMKLMTDRRARHLPVVEDGNVIGLVSIGDITKYRLAEKTEENSVLQDMAKFHLAAA